MDGAKRAAEPRLVCARRKRRVSFTPRVCQAALHVDASAHKGINKKAKEPLRDRIAPWQWHVTPMPHMRPRGRWDGPEVGEVVDVAVWGKSSQASS